MIENIFAFAFNAIPLIDFYYVIIEHNTFMVAEIWNILRYVVEWFGIICVSRFLVREISMHVLWIFIPFIRSFAGIWKKCKTIQQSSIVWLIAIAYVRHDLNNPRVDN